MTWKVVLYEYVHKRNEAEGGSFGRGLPLVVFDEAFQQAEAERLRRRHQVQQEREIRPLRHETKLKLLKTEELEGRIMAHIELTKRFEYMIRRQNITEEQAEQQRVTLMRRNGQWMITNILPYIAENDSTRPHNPAVEVAPSSSAAAAADVPPFPAAAAMPPAQTQASVPYMSGHVYTAQESGLRRRVYNRAAVRQYADSWWNGYNPQFVHMEVDCTNFISQCLFAGNAPMHYTGKRDAGWWYRGKGGNQELWSYSWAVAQSLQNYLIASRSGLRGEEVGSVYQLKVGDVISYSWDGARYTHSTVVTAIAPDGNPLVNAHTVNSRYRYWDYRDSYAWTQGTSYRFFHIPDQL